MNRINKISTGWKSTSSTLVEMKVVPLIAFTRTLLLRGGLVLVMPVFFGVDGVWWSVAAAELLGVVLSVVLLVLMRRRYHYA